MEECMRKLALWYTKTFKPIMTHDELEPIMATLGFISLPPTPSPANVGASAWKEYVFSAGGCRSPSPTEPRLPYPRIDGLHICTYRAFVDAVSFYLEKTDISDLFHVSREQLWERLTMERDCPQSGYYTSKVAETVLHL
ncbi:hypothetical protein HHK36_010504 [Tetracentron sinense]|uniref:Uncharacterized protein n=1 Tax=Tetracentron sinense TaxID=13715 RepID=A0A834ZF01_TETSI|nr:hypothetical protein HHK36_010504 [Tetracentron sinense]